MINLFSLGHFFQWFILGRYLITSWKLFFFISIGWEIIEIYLPYEFAQEEIINKIFDLIFNTLGFYLSKNRTIISSIKLYSWLF